MAEKQFIPKRRNAVMKEEVEKVLEMVRPGLRADGGDVELVETHHF
jgi:Fe-S cluster biogenesis protein NfuA